MSVSVNNSGLHNVKEELHLSENAATVLKSRYLKKDEAGKVTEISEKMFERVAEVVANADIKYGKDTSFIYDRYIEFYNIMVTNRFMPNSPTLMNAGRRMGMLSACFVLPVEDSIDGIFSSIHNTALIQKAGGGTGFDFSALRPAGDIVTSSGGTTSGPLSFIRVFSEATEAIQQGAFRRGANMGLMSIDHPDVVDFIHVKEDLTRLTNFNLSVKVTDAFMEKLINDPDGIHTVINPRTRKASPLYKDKKDLGKGVWTVQEVFNLIVDKAWNTGEPGVIFMDEVNRSNPTPQLGRIEATNPCGEQPLLPYEACNLGSINLERFVVTKNDAPKVDYDELAKTVKIAIRFLDNIIDINHYPLKEIGDICRANRKIGLGVMGFADALYRMRIPYNSDAAISFGEEIMEFIQRTSHDASEALAEEKGMFPNWEGSVWDTKHKKKMRNAAVTTVAPTGTISIIANCSGGIEPLFSLAFYRNVLSGKKLIEVNDPFKESLESLGLYSEKLVDAIIKGGSVKNIPGIPSQIKDIFITAHDISPQWHVKMQAAFQRHVDSSISKTINFSHDANKEEVEEIYRLAYQYKLKGVTVYRDGCRMNQPMALEKKKERQGMLVRPLKLPEIITCIRVRQKTPFGNMHIKISVHPKTEKELEVFAQLGKGGDIASSDLEGICRMLSLFLRCNGSIKLAVNQLSGIGSSLSVPSKDGRVMSLADGISKGIQKYLKAKELFGLQNLLLGKIDLDMLSNHVVNHRKEVSQTSENKFKVKCPECTQTLIFEEGCVKCRACGFSQC